MKTKTIRQTVGFKAPPAQIYKLLMDSQLHTEFSGSVARISTKVGGRISAYDGYIEAKNLELKPGKKIVQAWRGTDWPDDAWSVATFSLAATKTGTRLTFIQTGVPVALYADISQGWKDFYWEPMTTWLAEHA